MEERVFEKEGKSGRGDPVRAEANEFQHTQEALCPFFFNSFFLIQNSADGEAQPL